jgi:hypothetical protein
MAKPCYAWTRRFRGVRLAIERLDAHAFHQRGDVQPPDLEAFLHQ